MTTPTVALHPADERSIGYVERLLAANDLPTADVRAKPDCFFVATAGDDRVGVGGLEAFGETGLLRSVVVEESVRGTGVGAGLCTALEVEAAAAGVETLYLLTTTAAGFFAGHGYDELDRGDVPEPIRRTSEFADLCPASATCMRKSL